MHRRVGCALSGLVSFLPTFLLSWVLHFQLCHYQSRGTRGILIWLAQYEKKLERSKVIIKVKTASLLLKGGVGALSLERMPEAALLALLHKGQVRYTTEDDDAHLPFYDSAVKRSLPFTLLSFGHSPRQRGKAKGKGYLNSSLSLYTSFSVVGLK